MIFVMTFSLFMLWVSDGSKLPFRDKPPLFMGHQTEVLHHFESRRIARIYNAISTGNKTGISYKISKRFKKMGIYHLFTPSGIHLSSLLLLLSPILYLLRRKSRIYSFFIDLCILALVCTLQEMHSLKRIALLGLILRNAKFKGNRPSLFISFIATFFIAYIFGSYHQSPLSFIYSFLFLGVICASEGKPKYSIPIALFGAQLIVAYHQLSPIYWTNIILSPILTAIFSLMFPLLFLGNFISFTWPFMESLLKGYLWLVKMAEHISVPFGTVSPSIYMIGMMLLLLTAQKWSHRALLVSLCLFLHSESLYNLPASSILRVSGGKATSYGVIKEIKRTRRGFAVKYQNGKRCYPKLFKDGYYETCKS